MVTSDGDREIGQDSMDLEDLRLVSMMVVVIWLGSWWFDQKIKMN